MVDEPVVGCKRARNPDLSFCAVGGSAVVSRASPSTVSTGVACGVEDA